jgi:hypothetical protein
MTRMRALRGGVSSSGGECRKRRPPNADNAARKQAPPV